MAALQKGLRFLARRASRRRELRELLDKQAIRELVWRYCRAVDRRDFALLRTLYHEDAQDEHGEMFRGDAAAFLEWIPEVLAGMEVTMHNITNMLIEVDGAQAEGEIYTLVYHRPRGEAAARASLTGGRYLDQYSRRDGLWKFQHRRIVQDWEYLLPASEGGASPGGAGVPLGGAAPEDPSYRFLRRLAALSG